jgi:hypothetical protein
MSYNLSSSHQLIPNSQQYMLQYKFITINSEDRDVSKYANSSEFEIDLPQDYVNVQTVKLNSWSFPYKYDVFSEYTNNTFFTFSLRPFYVVGTTVRQGPNTTFSINIESGSYTPLQMATELTNKMNTAVNAFVKTLHPSSNEYTDFVVTYHEVNAKMWFGNRNSEFVLLNDSEIYTTNENNSNADCYRRSSYKRYVNWGLPYFLGFNRESVVSDIVTDDVKIYYESSSQWITSTVFNGVPNYIVADYKLNLDGPTHFYVEIAGMNNMDETMPKKIYCDNGNNGSNDYCDNGNMITKKSLQVINSTNESNGIVNSCFAKIPVPVKSDTDWFNTTSDSYMLYNPPAEKIRRLRIKIRYHNNVLVNFENFEFSFVLQLGIILPQIEKKFNVYVPESMSKRI